MAIAVHLSFNSSASLDIYPLAPRTEGSRGQGGHWAPLKFLRLESSSSINQPIQPAPPKQVIVEEVEVNIENIPSDPGLRPNIMSYPPNIRNQVYRACLLKGPCQPRHHKYPQKVDETQKWRFIASWFDEFSSWLEYSIEKDAAYCLYCIFLQLGVVKEVMMLLYLRVLLISKRKKD
ncbi:uncharacterized protein LOC131173002 [Hevea brasiliensis]|uniref:uncharacterized protein LOC131173002 n=1 Tax=Hevea brasiliensis TaxID=3981 RepID=UPI0025DD8F33|nr:uncharacterized protein LOC131173002 [Hevea brasiliensis]